MYVARWQVDARFGYKQTVIDLMRSWLKEVGVQAGADKMEPKLLTGTIGAKEARIEVDHTIETLEQLERFFEAIGKNEAHGKWAKELESYVVSGSSVWTIYRIL